MKNLVKLFLIVIAIMMATDKLFSQEFGIKAGFNSSNMHIVYDRMLSNDSNMVYYYHLKGLLKRLKILIIKLFLTHYILIFL